QVPACGARANGGLAEARCRQVGRTHGGGPPAPRASLSHNARRSTGSGRGSYGSGALHEKTQRQEQLARAIEIRQRRRTPRCPRRRQGRAPRLAARFICGGRVGRAKVLIEATRMALTDAWQARRIWKRVWFSDLVASSVRRNLRMASGLIPFTYIGAHLTNHALGLISLDTAERGMEIAVEVWYSVPGTLLLYGAAATHFILALWAVYERRTFRLPPLELLRIALGFTLPIILIG